MFIKFVAKIAFVMSVFGLAVFHPGGATAAGPIVTKAVAMDELLVLEGRRFGNAPRVFLGSSGGAFDELTVVSAGNNQIAAELPEVEPGTYLVVVRRGFRFALTDLTIGVPSALALSGIMANLLYGVTPTDPIAFVLAAPVLIAVAATSTFVPVRRALAVAPSEALRDG